MTKEQAIALAKARRRRAEASTRQQSLISAPAQQTPLNRELMGASQGERARYTQEMAAQAFGDRPSSGEYLQAGMFGTRPMRPSELAGNIDLTQGEPGIEPAFMPDLFTGIGAAAVGSATKNLIKSRSVPSRDFLDDLVTPYQSRRQQITQELRGADKDIKGTYKFRLSKAERQQKEVLSTVKGINPQKNLRDNLGVVLDEIKDSGDKLAGRLSRSKAVITNSEVEFYIRRQFAQYMDSLEGLDAGLTDDLVEEAIAKVLKAYDANPSNPLGLWKTRQDIDKLYQNMKGSRRYQNVVGNLDLQPTRAEIVFDNTRKALLDLMENKVPDTRQQMRRISILHDVKQTMAEKAPDVGKTLYKRTKQAVGLGDKTMSLKPRNWKQ